MSKYDSLLTELKPKLVSASSILICLPSSVNADKLAAGLSLYLALEQMGKQINIVSEGVVLVAHSNLYGIGKIKNQLPQIGGGDLTITLEGVVAPDGSVPSLEKLDWYPEGPNLNLVFHVVPGQTFNPTRINPKTDGGLSNLVFVIGASSLNDLGNIYLNNNQAFSGTFIVNIDNSLSNTKFGQVNIVDSTPSVSELVAWVMNDLGLALNSDITSNILAGVYSATSNMTANVTPETFMAVGLAMQAGGQIPGAMPSVSAQAQPIAPAQPFGSGSTTSASLSTSSLTTSAQGGPTPVPTSVAQVSSPSLANNPFIPPVADSFSYGGQVSTPVPSSVPASVPDSAPAPVEQPAPDWLTPKVYKGGSLG